MRLLMPCLSPLAALRRLNPFFVCALLAIAVFASSRLNAQATAPAPADRIIGDVNSGEVVALPNHHPIWADKANDAGLLPSTLPVDHLTLVLSRSPQRESALEKFLAEQQDVNSPNYHRWLSPAEMGARFGLSDHDIAALTGWLRSQGLHVSSISPSRTFIEFGGTAGAVGRAFRTELHRYKGTAANGVGRMSVFSDPMIPLALAPAIKAIHGLYTVEDRPLHHAKPMRLNSPYLNASNGDHFLAPADFATIYDLPSGTTGAGQTIGIVGRSRTNFADFDNFRLQTSSSFSNPTEIVPTAFGGVDPGPALTSPPGTGVSDDDQLEATLDVMRAGSVAPSAQLLLVVATSDSGGIGTDARYLVETSPLPAQVMTISFGACESSAGPSNVAFWDSLFQQATAEGISVFVSSGDAGASGCDNNFKTPPADPEPNSPNYICSSSYATCVGGTEFNDTGSPSQYWSSSNSGDLGSAFGYIPEGAWNEPLNSSSETQAAASGGGVSTIIPTPNWQTGTGVPSARSGRYTPDIAFSASGHDGYFACFAAGGAGCVDNANGSFEFEAFYGTSAAAPAMAGITALLNQTLGSAQGNLNPQLYKLATSSPASFHDVTVASSGVTVCDVKTPSMCNNSLPGPTGLTGGQAGYLVTAGYDEVTGLGSLDVSSFIDNFATPPTIEIKLSTPGLTFPSQLIGFSNTIQVGIENSGTSALNPLTIAISGTNAGDFSESDNCQAALTAGSACTVQVKFTPTAVGTRTASMTVSSTNGVNSPQIVTLSGSGTNTLYTPAVTTVPSPSTVITTQAFTVKITVTKPAGAPKTPTGAVTLTSGSYSSAATALSTDTATIDIPAGSLPAGTDVLTAAYTPDSASSAIFNKASGTADITVEAPPPPAFSVTASTVSVAPGATAGNTSSITITPSGGFTGNVALTASLTSSPAGAQDAPTFSFGSTSPVDVTGTGAGTAALTISTTAPQTSALAYPATGTRWYATGAASLGCLLFLIAPVRLRRRRTVLGMAVLLIALGGMTACGGGSSKTTAPPSNPGTTAGTYTITVTGTSGSTTAAGTVTLTVQ